MGAIVKFGLDRGNTVPYPPIFDDIRRNHGFVDTRDRPDRVIEIPEARESEALASLLRLLAAPETPLISLGCDLGQHEAPKSRFETRRVAGGYIQVIATQREPQDLELAFLKETGKRLERGLIETAAGDRWEIELRLAPVKLNLELETECQSIWIWFLCKSSSYRDALASRERLLKSLAGILCAARIY